MSTGKTRRKSVARKVFLAAVKAGIKANQTAEEVANGLGMAVSSFNVRLSQERGKIRDLTGKELPSLAGSGSGRKGGMSDEDAAAELADILEG